MNILKPQNVDSKKLNNKYIKDILESQNVEQCIFQNEECNNINLYENQFEYCKFDNVCIQNGLVEKSIFKEVSFTQCNFSNTQFKECEFIKCEFDNCKVSGCDLSENILYNVTFRENNASYINLSMASIKNVLFKDTILKNSYFHETKIKNIYFNNVDLTQAQFFKTSLKGVDLSNSKIEGIAVSIEDINGAIIDQLQAMDLLYLIGVKLK